MRRPDTKLGMKSISALVIQEERCILAHGVHKTLQLKGEVIDFKMWMNIQRS